MGHAFKLRPPRDAVDEESLPPFRRRGLGDRRKMVELLEQLDKDAREKGQSCSVFGGPRAVRVFEAIALTLYPDTVDALRLSLDEIAAAAGCSRETVNQKLKLLAEWGFLPYQRVYRAGRERDGFKLAREWGRNCYHLPDLRTFAALCESGLRTARLYSQERVLLVWTAPDRAALEPLAGENPILPEADVDDEPAQSSSMLGEEVERPVMRPIVPAAPRSRWREMTPEQVRAARRGDQYMPIFAKPCGAPDG